MYLRLHSWVCLISGMDFGLDMIYLCNLGSSSSDQGAFLCFFFLMSASLYPSIFHFLHPSWPLIVLHLHYYAALLLGAFLSFLHSESCNAAL
jgi:hypothetical protein